MIMVIVNILSCTLKKEIKLSTKYELLLLSNDGIAILYGDDGKMYKSLFPYKNVKQITFTEYQNIAYMGEGGTCYPLEGKYVCLKEATNANIVSENSMP